MVYFPNIILLNFQNKFSSTLLMTHILVEEMENQRVLTSSLKLGSQQINSK